MEFLYLSPEFPPNYANFVLKLDEMNVNVWGIGEADFHFMPETLRSALKWYVSANLSSTAEVEIALENLLRVKASLGTSPNFDMVESHNEQWLQLEGFINHKLGIDGIQPKDLNRLKKKSVMKKLFKEIDLPVARGERVTDFNHGLQLADDLGYPLILKPDEGVGANGIHKVTNEAHLRHLLAEIKGDYLMEEFIDAKIVTFDGLVDGNGRILFENSISYGEGVLEYVLGKDTFFYVSRHIPDKLLQIGRRLTKLFDIRRKFFHFEFFMVGDDYMPIEINCRPPGGAILDMMNYSVDDDLYAAYARMIANSEAAVAKEKKYYCCYLGRRDKDYVHSHSDILAEFGHCLTEYAENPLIFQQAMGKYRYILRSKSESEILRIADFVLRKP
jgi:biotin carboxylase